MSHEMHQLLLRGVLSNDMSLMQKALMGGADPNHEDAGGPLYSALISEHPDSLKICELLLGAGAKPELDRRHNISPLRLCTWAEEKREKAELLIMYGARLDAVDARSKEHGSILSEAVHNQNAPLVDLLIQEGAPINLGAPDGELTPLIMAATTNSPENVKKVLAAGADPSLAVGGLRALDMVLKWANEEDSDAAECAKLIVLRLRALGAHSWHEDAQRCADKFKEAGRSIVTLSEKERLSQAIGGPLKGSLRKKL